MSAIQSISSISMGMVLFPNLTQLDFTGPYEVFAKLPKTSLYILAETLEPIRSDRPRDSIGNGIQSPTPF